MLTLIDFAKLALHVYKDPKDKKYLGQYVKMDHPITPREVSRSQKGDGVYEVLIDPNVQSPYALSHNLHHFGFHASFYVKTEGHKLKAAVIAIRGTNNLFNDVIDVDDWWETVMLKERPKLPTYYSGLALAFYHKAWSFCKKYNIHSKDLYVTGHSLGGAIAALLPAHSGCPIKAITFNAPGIADMKKVKHAYNLVINFRSAYDFVSAIDHAVGNLFPIHVPEKEVEAKEAFQTHMEHRENGWTRWNIIKDLMGIEHFLVSVLPQHKMEHLYQIIAETYCSTAHPEAYLDPFAPFAYFEHQLILPAPFITLYPGQNEELQASA